MYSLPVITLERDENKQAVLSQARTVPNQCQSLLLRGRRTNRQCCHRPGLSILTPSHNSWEGGEQTFSVVTGKDCLYSMPVITPEREENGQAVLLQARTVLTHCQSLLLRGKRTNRQCCHRPGLSLFTTSHYSWAGLEQTGSVVTGQDCPYSLPVITIERQKSKQAVFSWEMSVPTHW